MAPQGDGNTLVFVLFVKLIFISLASFLTLFGVGARTRASRIHVKRPAAKLVALAMALGKGVESMVRSIGLRKRLGDVNLQIGQ